MENVVEYIVKSSGLIAAFYLTYTLLLRNETFFRGNRWFLLLGLLTSVLLPLVTFEKVIWVAPTPTVAQWTALSNTLPTQTESFEINWYLVFGCVYGLGLFVLLFQFLFDFKHLKALLKGRNIQQVQDYKLIDVNEKVAPFSYFNYIVYNSELFSEDELNHILAHERVHCEQKHSIDVLISRLFCIVFWYNPFVWLYKKAMMQNLEFIADTEALKTLEDKKSYQITLLKVTTQHNCVAITNPFYQSLIKKRIVMLNKNQSKKSNYWKYFVMVPALLAFLFYFQVKVIAQERKDGKPEEQVMIRETVVVEINKDATDEEIKKDAEQLKREHNIKLKCSKIKRNAAGEIVAIKVEYDDAKGSKGITQFRGDEPIKPIRFYKNDDGAIGFATGNDQQKGYAYKFVINDDDDNEATEIVELVDAPEAPEAVEAPEAAEQPEAPEAPEAPMSPKPGKMEKRVIIKKGGDAKSKIQVVVNGEILDLDSDKIIAELEPMMNSSLFSLEEFQNDIDLKELGKIKKKALLEARISMQKARPDLEKARIEIKRIKPEMLRARQEMESAKPELEAAKKEMEAAKEELRQARIEIEKSRAELDKIRAENKKK
ncbi:MAG: peptidase M56 [Flavobacterium sp.]|nr:peptidase M56 [Flavobacterium sp.]